MVIDIFCFLCFVSSFLGLSPLLPKKLQLLLLVRSSSLIFVRRSPFVVTVVIVVPIPAVVIVIVTRWRPTNRSDLKRRVSTVYTRNRGEKRGKRKQKRGGGKRGRVGWGGVDPTVLYTV